MMAWVLASHTPPIGPQGVDFGGRPLSFIIGEAYNVLGGRIVGPGSLTREALWGPLTQGYDIVAKTDHEVPKEQLRLMLQSLLADRFKLKVHWESKTRPVYKLAIAKGGPKLEASEGGDLVISSGPDGFAYRNAEISRLCGALSSFVGRVVIDDTGLKGLYNFVVKRPEGLRQDQPAKSTGESPDLPSVGAFAETLKRLGLQLISGTAPVDYLVVERPSDN